MTPQRFDKLSKRDPMRCRRSRSMALGAVLSTRMLDVSRKFAVT
jgi:hypothetical protein